VDAEQIARAVGHTWAGSLAERNLARRLALRLRHLIEGGVIVAGTRLPSERALALALHVSRPTVTDAFDELRSAGALRSRQGSGTWVAERGPATGEPAMAELVLATHGINLAAAAPADVSHLEHLDLRLADLLAATPAHGHDPVGLPALRAALAERLATTPDELVVTSGAHHALTLILGALTTPGDPVLVEDCTYPGFLDLLAAHRAVAVATGRDDDGVTPDALDHALRTAGTKLVYLTPAVHAPSGRATPAARLDALAAVLDQHGATVLIDDTLADVRYGTKLRGLAARCARAQAITVGSLSKSVWGGLRIGWLRAPAPLRQAILRHRAQVDLGTAIASQRIAQSVVEDLDAILATRIETLRAKRTRLVDALPAWDVQLPDGGLTLWARLPVSGARFAAAAHRHGVVVMPGHIARPDGRDDGHVRLCFDREPALLDEGAARLTAAYAELRAE